ncbi:MAG: hypothetical protein OEN55_10920 [Alphaproteobacteria bacterium]|nr:hypothetical protein [Alphaproteobacteria bacterium]
MRIRKGATTRHRAVFGHRLVLPVWRRAALLGAAILLTGLLPQLVRASELGAFNDAFADAWGHYRQAVFYGRSGNTAVAALELGDFVTKWSALATRFGDNPPDAFANDRAWKETLESIGTMARRGLGQLDAGDSEAAQHTLAPVRGIAGDLRRRNGVTVYSDDIDELSAAMDILARYRREVEDLGDPEAVAMATRQASVVAYLFERCDTRAPAAIRDDPEFRRLIDGARDSLDKLRASLRSGDIRLYRIGIGELRSYERILFLRFG